jgi:hypothetical protein
MAVNVDFDYFSRHSEAGYVSFTITANLGLSHLLSQTRDGHLAVQLGLIRVLHLLVMPERISSRLRYHRRLNTRYTTTDTIENPCMYQWYISICTCLLRYRLLR